MIGRWWRGWASRENADAYEQLLRTRVLPEIRGLEGHRGAYLLRRDTDGEHGEEVEFATLTLWESWEAVREFAGDDYEVAVVPAEARAVLSRFDERSVHFEIVVSPE